MKAYSAGLPFEALPLYTPLQTKHLKQLSALEQLCAASPWRPEHHLLPPCGLTNDPNGLYWDGSRYHVFCQWFPFGSRHGMKHWFQFTSPDLLHWQNDCNLLIPDQPYEKNGCYSGNAWKDPADQSVWLYYTANYKDENLRKIPMQAAAKVLADGSLEKSRKNPVLQGSPAGVGDNIRDPFVFDWKDRTFMLLGAESNAENAEGLLLLYQMKDPETFEYLGPVDVRLDGKRIDLGRMLECPGLIQTDGTDLLFLSIIGDSTIDHTPNRFASVVLQGTFDPDALLFEGTTLQNTDEGFDFYAPQPFYGKDGQPLLFGWFGNGDQLLPEDKYGWRHALSLPRMLKVEDGILKTPVCPQAAQPFLLLEQEPASLTESGDEITRIQPSAVYRLHADFEDDQKRHIFQIGDPDDFFSIVVDLKDHMLTVDRSTLKTPVDLPYGPSRSFAIPHTEKSEFDLLADHSFFELYWNDGQKVLSFRAYPPQAA